MMAYDRYYRTIMMITDDDDDDDYLNSKQTNVWTVFHK